jgi:hypothetical protein
MMFREGFFLKMPTSMQWIGVMSRERQEADVLNGRISNRKAAG